MESIYFCLVTLHKSGKVSQSRSEVLSGKHKYSSKHEDVASVIAEFGQRLVSSTSGLVMVGHLLSAVAVDLEYRCTNVSIVQVQTSKSTAPYPVS